MADNTGNFPVRRGRTRQLYEIIVEHEGFSCDLDCQSWFNAVATPVYRLSLVDIQSGVTVTLPVPPGKHGMPLTISTTLH